MTVFDRLRAACAAVMAEARHVRLEHARIRPYALSLPLAGAQGPQYDPRHHFAGDPETTAAYVLMLDAVNFGSGYFPRLEKRPGLSGYYTVASSLKDLFEERGAPSAEELLEMRPEDCARLFGQPPGDEARDELMSLFAQALRELGGFLQGRFGGSPAGLVESAQGSAEGLVLLLSEMPMFGDVVSYDGLELPFLKRAQITVTDLALAFNGGGLGYFRDLSALTIFADNLVPHVLRVDGLLHYDEALAARIEAGELIAAGSSEEIEIRAAAVHAVELMVAALRGAGQEVTARDLDYLLWNRGQEARYKARPRHRTRTIFY